MAEKKKRFAILLDGEKVGESWAVSSDKAITNHWWKYDKLCNPYTRTNMSKHDYDAVEI